MNEILRKAKSEQRLARTEEKIEHLIILSMIPFKIHLIAKKNFFFNSNLKKIK